MKKTKLVLMRHGESVWNKTNQFTGWKDMDLSKNGIKEACKAGKSLKKNNFYFDIAYTSMLKRAIHTTWNILDVLNQAWIELNKTWRLNERHYGALQGMNKDKIALKYGNKQLQLWRRSFNTIPPQINEIEHNNFVKDKKYENVNIKDIPYSESLHMTCDRVIPFWKTNIFPEILNNKKVIIVAHGNSLRALIKHIDQVTDNDIVKIEIPTATPIVYEFDENFKPIKSYFMDVNK
ncbi:2,3-diphosphoglycerate-dependent phosphoglycerate mutase [Buchnera aphidicola (Taiwanaphis decaspermi)]|uniref:2,3-diphosphoglycerate-dependent phosphoglycerate mutase n=1 Tax=Buchnera aphidicola TaxID=9 RepID=UPI0031B81646